jgi:hypothetical protein
MTAVVVSAGQFAAALLMGMGLGVVYELLRPLRPKHTACSDGLFVAAVWYAWIYLGFGICGGDIRMVQVAGLLLGALAFRLTLGKLLQRVIFAISASVRQLFGPVRRFLKKIWNFQKKIFASGKKSVKIKWSNRRHLRRIPGGKAHGKKKKSLQPDPAGLSAQQAFDQDGRDRGHRTVYGGADFSGYCQTCGKSAGK